MDPAALAADLAPMLAERNFTYTDPSFVADVIVLLRERVTFLKDIAEFGDYLFGDTLAEVDEKDWSAITSDDAFKGALEEFGKGLTADTIHTEEAFKELSKQCATNAGLKMGKFMKPLRIVLTHRLVGAELYPTIKLLGVDRSISRINEFLSK